MFYRMPINLWIIYICTETWGNPRDVDGMIYIKMGVKEVGWEDVDLIWLRLRTSGGLLSQCSNEALASIMRVISWLAEELAFHDELSSMDFGYFWHFFPNEVVLGLRKTDDRHIDHDSKQQTALFMGRRVCARVSSFCGNVLTMGCVPWNRKVTQNVETLNELQYFSVKLCTNSWCDE
jgi:hypothetical protein